MAAAPASLFEKIWNAHVIRELGDDRYIVRIDRHLVHEGTSRDAFDGLRRRSRGVRNRGLTFAVVDHDKGTVSHHPGSLSTPHAAQAAFNSHASKAQPLAPDSPLARRNP